MWSMRYVCVYSQQYLIICDYVSLKYIMDDSNYVNDSSILLMDEVNTNANSVSSGNLSRSIINTMVMKSIILIMTILGTFQFL